MLPPLPPPPLACAAEAEVAIAALRENAAVRVSFSEPCNFTAA